MNAEVSPELYAVPVREPNGGPLKVLYVEDDPSIRNLIKIAMEMNGYIVTTASDGFEGLDRLHAAGADGYDALVVDVMMPGIDGVGLIRALRDDLGSKIPAIVYSGVDRDEVIEAAREAGADAFLRKPIEFCEIPIVLSDLIEKRAQGNG